MQQQIAQQEQYGNQHQISQPMMICPIQYVYETPMLMPHAQERQIQQNQNVLFNVQNPPPWIQNRPQNQVIYVQQVPSNYQTFIHPQMMQNLYHPQINYQIQQPMLAQDNRQFVQIPNLANFNAVQSQQAQPPQAQPAPTQQQINNDEVADKMPLLTQMLNQKPVNNINVRAPTINNVRPNTPTGNNANAIRPVTQNQQVQTNISANNKGRPRNGSPQIISINPMQQRQIVNANQKPDVLINIRTPVTPYIRAANVPQHIRSKIPSSISVKTVHRPVQIRSTIRPDVMPSPQNFVYNSNFVSAPYPETRNIMTNTDCSYFKQNNNFQGIRTPKPADANVQTEAPAVGKLPVAKNPCEAAPILKQLINSNVTANPKIDQVNVNDSNADKTNIEMNTERSVESQPQTEEKLIRNTVYVQARGRVLNEKEILQNQSLKRTNDSRLEEERIANNAINSQTIQKDPIHSSNKYVGIDNTSQTNKPFAISSVSRASRTLNTQQSRINNLSVNFENTKSTDLNTPEPEKLTSEIASPNCHKLETPNPVKDLEQKSENSKNITSDIKIECTEDSQGPSEVPIVNNNSNVADKSNTKNLRLKSDKIKILTHVLDGYIIQESNVAFPIYKPIMEKEYQQCTLIREESKNAVTNKQNNSIKEESKTAITTVKIENAIAEENSANPDLTSRNENKSIEPEKEMDSGVNNKDNPFANVKKSAVGSWTAEELAAHLVKCEWRETAVKLQDEEIDGESLLLVNKDQLVAIGVCEHHAEVIAVFSAS